MPFVGSVEGTFGYGRGPNAPDNIMNAKWSVYLTNNNTTFEPKVSIATDNLNNTYMASTYFTATQININRASGTSQTISAYNLPTGGNNCLIKYDSAGQVIWATYFTTTNASQISGIVCDSSNNVYIVGLYTHINTYLILRNVSGTTTVESSYTLPPTLDINSTSGFIIKYNTTGQVQWATYLGDSGTHRLFGIACYSNVLFITGFNSSSNPTTLMDVFGTSQSSSSITLDSTNNVLFSILLKYNTDGLAQWATYIPTSSRSFKVCCDSLGNPVLVGQVAITPASLVLKDANNNSQIDSQWSITKITNITFFVIKYINSTGVVSWATTLPTNSNTFVYSSIAIDSLDNIYITSSYTSSASITLNNANTATFNQSPSLFTLPSSLSYVFPLLVKYNSSGTVLWGTYIIYGKPTYKTAGIDLCIKKGTDYVYITGTVNPTAPVNLINANNTSQIASSVTFNTTTQTGNRVFIIKYNSNGIITCATYLNTSVTTGDTTGYSIVTYGNNLYIGVFSAMLASGGTLFNAQKNTQVTSSYTINSTSGNNICLLAYTN
jgi:hypothetical protein